MPSTNPRLHAPFPSHLVLAAALASLLAVGPWTGCTTMTPPPDDTARETVSAAPAVDRSADLRVALFNVRELDAEKLNQGGEAGAGGHPQLRAAAAVVQRVRPDVLVVQEIDFPQGEGAAPTSLVRAFADRYLAHPQDGGGEPLDYPYAYAAPVNTGILSGLDLNRDGRVATVADRGERAHGDDSLGWGTYPGQYGMAVLSRFPLDAAGARTFRTFRAAEGLVARNRVPARGVSARPGVVWRVSVRGHAA